MEVWGMSYGEILDIPTTRRHRLLKKKIDLERRKDEQNRANISNSRSRMRR